MRVWPDRRKPISGRDGDCGRPPNTDALLVGVVGSANNDAFALRVGETSGKTKQSFESVSVVLEDFITVVLVVTDIADRVPLTRSGDDACSGCPSLGANLSALGGSIVSSRSAN